MKGENVIDSPFVSRKELRLLSILAAIETNGPQRFTDLGHALDLHTNQVNRALKELVRSRRLEAHIEPGEYPNRVRYQLTSLGEFELGQARERLEHLSKVDSPDLQAEARSLATVMATA